MSAYFITGAGTGVGKTFTTCALLHADKKARGYKPVISGWDEEEETDTHQIIVASGSGSVKEISPWRFSAPLSPHRAAALEGKTIDTDELIAWTRSKAPERAYIETVGGVMVPLTDRFTTLDWMAAVGLPVILVTGSYLGAISHTLTALEVLRARKLAIKALVMCESDGSAVPLEEAEAGLAPFVADIALRAVQPIVPSWKEAHAIMRLGEKL